MTVTLYHNPKCATSRAVLEMLRARGFEPRIVEYLKTPLTGAELASLAKRMGVPARAIVRAKEPLYGELGLDRPATTDAQLFEAMVAYPILLNRPIVETDRGVRLCRPAEVVTAILPDD